MKPTGRAENQRFRSVSIWFLVLSNLLVFQLGGWILGRESVYSNVQVSDDPQLVDRVSGKRASALVGGDILGIPQGEAVALPSVRINETEAAYKRNIYGGKGDKPHLGGFASHGVDRDGMSPRLWKMMIEEIGVKSVLDVGCGRGVSTSWFLTHGADVLCVEGSHDAIEQSLLPSDKVTEHDFSRGPWWPPRTFDAAWSVEVLEHIGRNFHVNLLPSFRKAALIFATHSTWGGWHHVETHDTEWWVNKMESFGFIYSEDWSEKLQHTATMGYKDKMPNGDDYFAQHLRIHLMVFMNPRVASLPEHHHLFAEEGCYLKHEKGNGERKMVHRECGTGNGEGKESILPDSFKPIKLNAAMDDKWERLVFGKTLKEASAEPDFGKEVK